jgi:hypothetical protein
MSRPTPEELITEWERKKAVKAAEREVIAAAERFHDCFDHRTWVLSVDGIIDAVSKLREARGENAG